MYCRLSHNVVTSDEERLISTATATASGNKLRSAIYIMKLGCDWGILILHCSIVPASHCSLSGPLLHCSPVVVFFDCGHPCFRNFNPTIPVDVIRVLLR